LSALEAAGAQQQAALEAAQETVAGGKAREAQLRDAVRVLEEEEGRAKSELRDVRDRLMACRSEADANTGMGKIIRLLATAVNANAVSGFHGRLGDLGTIDPKYDVAVSTAAPGLNNLVIDSEKEATKCIALMKKKEVGRATFCILDRQRDLAAKCRTRIETPEGVPRLFDLVRPIDERFAPAFYHALRDTLVAADIDQGTRIAYEQKDGRRWRVVTLDGKIIDLAGTMTGGGSRPSTGLLKLLSAEAAAKKGAAGQHKLGVATKEDVERLTQEEASCLRELDHVMNELAAAQQQVKLHAADLERCQLEVPKLQMRLASDAGRRAELSRRLPELEKACALSQEERRELARLE
jgi:structural maintenance of chromosome 4